jgi:hypothetical protein
MVALEDEVGEYDRLKSGEVALPHVERLNPIAPCITRIRIAKGVSQTELVRRLGVSKHISRLQEILDAIGIKVDVTLSA